MRTCINCGCEEELETYEDFEVRKGVTDSRIEEVFRINCFKCGALKYAVVKPQSKLE